MEQDDKGRRIVRTEIEVQATPEQVWKAIATGPGFKAWFMGMENEFEEQVGGEITTKMGDQVVPIAKITAWDPPHLLATEGNQAFGPNSPTIAYEWTIEARGGGKCVLRLVQTLFAEDDSWDDQVGDTEAGWPAFFHLLRNYVERHNEEPSGVVQAMGPVPGSKDEAFDRLTAALGVSDVRKGAAVESDMEGVLSFSGVIEDVVRGRSNRVMIRLEKPFPGTAWIGAGPIRSQMTAIATLYYYGEGAAEASARDGAQLNEWLQGHGEAVSS